MEGPKWLTHLKENSESVFDSTYIPEEYFAEIRPEERAKCQKETSSVMLAAVEPCGIAQIMRVEDYSNLQRLAVDLTGPLPTGESLLITVDYYSRWIEADVDRNTTSSSIINCLEKLFTSHGIPETLRTDNGSNLVNHEMEEFLDELEIKHKRTINPLWPRANGEVERQNKSLLKAMLVGHTEGKPWQRELQKYQLAYRSTPHTTTGVSPAELLYGRRIGTKMPEFESTGEEGERPGTAD